MKNVKTRRECMDRNVPYLLKKYETKDVNEIWTTEHELEYKQNQRYKQKIHQLDGLINELHGNFIITHQDKERMKYLIKHLNMDNANLTTEQHLIMIIIYVKLENNTNRQISDYQSLLRKYGLTTNTFTRFQMGIIQHYIQRIYG